MSDKKRKTPKTTPAKPLDPKVTKAEAIKKIDDECESYQGERKLKHLRISTIYISYQVLGVDDTHAMLRKRLGKRMPEKLKHYTQLFGGLGKLFEGIQEDEAVYNYSNYKNAVSFTKTILKAIDAKFASTELTYDDVDKVVEAICEYGGAVKAAKSQRTPRPGSNKADDTEADTKADETKTSEVDPSTAPNAGNTGDVSTAPMVETGWDDDNEQWLITVSPAEGYSVGDITNLDGERVLIPVIKALKISSKKVKSKKTKELVDA